jgi:diadenylate cyclase
METLAWSLQILILTLGIYLFLRFLRSTQGSRIVRGLAIGLPVIVVSIWGTATYLKLAELQFILQNIGGYAVVFIAILFQEELRRGMAQFGENPLVNRFVTSLETDVLEEVSSAAIAMATKQESHGSFTRVKPHGALIVFERVSSLKSYIVGGRRLDAVVSKDFIESVFQPKSPLHDGALIIRKDRVAAVSCMLPLTQNLSIAKTTGTRHRAAIGLSEETDAVTLVVSEETGKISIATGGKLRHVPQADLAGELRLSLGADTGEKKGSFGQRASKFLREDLAWFAGSILLAYSILFIAQGSISKTREFTLSVVETPYGSEVDPEAGTLALRLPGHDYHLVTPVSNQTFTVLATGPIGKLDLLGASLAGTIAMEQDGGLTTRVGIDDIHFLQSAPLNVEFQWADDAAPEIEVVRYESLSITLGPENVTIDQDNLDVHFELASVPVTFEVSTVEVTGPPDAIAALLMTPELFKLQDVALTNEDINDHVEILGLHPDLVKAGLSLANGLRVRTTVSITPVRIVLDREIERELTLTFHSNANVNLARLDRWRLKSSQLTVSFRVVTQGILPTNVDSDLYKSEETLLLGYVNNNLSAYVDIEDQPEEGTPIAIPIKTRFSDANWRKFLGKEEARFDRASLELQIVRDPIIVLDRTTPPTD